MFCLECFQNYFEYMIDDHNHENNLKCPLSDCAYIPTDTEIKWIADEKTYKRYLEYKSRINGQTNTNEDTPERVPYRESAEYEAILSRKYAKKNLLYVL